jgi:hypothetical protein
MKRFYSTREFYIPKGSTKIADKASDAVAYISEHSGKLYGMVFWGDQSKPVANYRYRNAAEREKSIGDYFKRRQEIIAHKANRKAEAKAKAIEFRASVEVGDIFHYSFGYDETHHVFYEITEIQGRHAIVRRIAQAQKDLGYDWRHECMPQSGKFIGEPKRVLLQDGCIKVDHHYHATKWNTRRVAGVPIGPSYTGGGCH